MSTVICPRPELQTPERTLTMKKSSQAQPVLPRGRAVVGIDIGKGKHAATALSRQGEVIAQLASFPNTRQGVDHEGQVRRAEKRLPARVDAVDAVGDNAGDGGGHDDFGLKFRRAVKHLGGKQRAGQRARKMAAMPAPIPAATSVRRSATLSRKRFAKSEPKPAPIRAIGPSRPPEPPEPMVSALATILISGTRGRICPCLR